MAPPPAEEPRTAASQAPAGDTGPWAAHGHCRTWMENDVAQYTEKVPILTSALKAKFTIDDVIYVDVKIAKNYSWWTGGHSWTHAELQLNTFHLILRRMHARPLAFRYSEI